MALEEIVSKVVEKIDQMEDGEKSTIGFLIKNVTDSYFETNDYFIIQKEVIEILKGKGIILDYSEHEGKEEGLPWTLTFIKRTEKTEKHLNDIEKIELASKLLKISIDEVKKYSSKIPDIDAIYISIPVKGGDSLIVGSDGQVLYAGSSVGYDSHIKEYLNGRRTPLSNFK